MTANAREPVRNAVWVQGYCAALQDIESGDLIAQLKAFGRDCVQNGDMTPSGERMLLQILGAV